MHAMQMAEGRSGEMGRRRGGRGRTGSGRQSWNRQPRSLGTRLALQSGTLGPRLEGAVGCWGEAGAGKMYVWGPACTLQAHVPAVGLRRAPWACSFVPGEETSRAFLSAQNIFPSTSFRPRPLKALQQYPRAPRTSRSPRSPQHLPVQGLAARGPSTPSRVPNGPKSPKAPAQLKQLPLTKQQMAKTPSGLALGPGLLCFLGEEARMVSARPWLEDSTARLVQQTGATVRGLAGRALSLIAAGIVIVMSFGGAWLPEALTGALRICAHSSHDS